MGMKRVGLGVHADLHGMAYYHVTSRFADRMAAMETEEKQQFLKIMRAAEIFSGVRILTYAVMKDHFHILMMVPRAAELSDEEVIARMGTIYTDVQMQNFQVQWQLWRDAGDGRLVEKNLEDIRQRMCDLSAFMKTLKQRFSMYYNGRHHRDGTLWCSLFKSVLVEGTEAALATVAAYIDLNAVRSGLVEDPADYRFCGYAEALGGSSWAQAGVAAVLDWAGREPDWREALARYRVHLHGDTAGAEPAEATLPRKLSQEEVDKVLAKKGTLDRVAMLRCHVSAMTNGRILGSPAFVNAVMPPPSPGYTRRCKSAKPIAGNGLPICAAHTIRLRAVVVPSAADSDT